MSAYRDTDILSLESDEFLDLYEATINVCEPQRASKRGAKSRVTQDAGERLATFHAFLAVTYDASPVEFSELYEGGPSAEEGVDANLLSAASYDEVKKILCPNFEKAAYIRKIQWLITVLGFRCGLRRNEARKLRVVDLQGVKRPELLVRSSRYGYVKSASSVRRIPLFALLEPEELEALLDWKARRSRSAPGHPDPNALLFPQEGTQTEPFREADVFDDIQKVMRLVTGDPTVRFHHFRHSFATWLALRLLWDFSPEERASYAFLNHPLFDPAACGELRKTLLGNMALGRQALFAVAQLCGHSGPSVTLLHYIHLCDWMLGLELARMENEPALPDAATLATVTGAKSSKIYYGRNSLNTKQWKVSSVLDELPPIGDKINLEDFVKVKLRPLADTPPAREDSSLSLWTMVTRLVREWQATPPPSLETLAKRYRCKEEDARRWCATTERLKSMTTERGGLRHVNYATRKKAEKGVFPHRVSEANDKKMAMDVFKAFDSFTAGERKRLLKWVAFFNKTFKIKDKGVRCETAQQIEDYIGFLHDVGIEGRQIRVVRTPPQNGGKQGPRLPKKLNPRDDCFVVEKKVPPADGAVDGKVYIQVLDKTPAKGARPSAAYGFRYAMYLLEIMHGGT